MTSGKFRWQILVQIIIPELRITVRIFSIQMKIAVVHYYFISELSCSIEALRPVFEKTRIYIHYIGVTSSRASFVFLCLTIFVRVAVIFSC